MNLTPQQRNIADQIVSVFENSNPEIQYDYCENLNDGRGYTAGRAGFCTGTGDLYEVVKMYTKDNPDNALSDYLPTLKQLADDESDDVSDLEGFADDWKEACNDEDFKRCQDAIVDEQYFNPAMQHCQKIGLQNASSAACLYDTCIQHGDGDDGDSLGSIIEKTNDRAGGTVKNGVDENKWISTFLEVRREDLLNPENSDTQDEWKESVGRVDALKQIVETNTNLEGALAFNAFGDNYNLTA